MCGAPLEPLVIFVADRFCGIEAIELRRDLVLRGVVEIMSKCSRK